MTTQKLSIPLTAGIARRTLAILALVSVTAGACASDDGGSTESDSQPATSPAPETVTDEPTAPTTSADSPQAVATECPGTEPLTLSVAAIAGSRAMTTGLWLGVAERSGILDEEGITLDIIDFTSEADVNNGLLSGDLDVAVNGSGGIVATAQGGDVIGIAGAVDVSVWEPLVNPERVSGWDDLAGKTVAVSSQSGVAWAVLGDLLGQLGLTHDDIDPVVIGSTFENYAALEAGQVDWVPGAAPVTFIGEDAGFQRLGYAPPDGEVPLFTSGYVSTTRSFAEESPDEVVRFLRAWVKTARWAKDSANFDQLVEMATEISQVDESVARRSMELYLQGDIHAPYFLPEDGRINETSLQNLMDSMVDQGILEEAPTIDEVWTDEYVSRAVDCIGPASS